MDRAGEAKPKQAASVIDSSLSPVPETVGGICGVSKATQTQAPPTSPPPSDKEKVRNTAKHMEREHRGKNKQTPHVTNSVDVHVFVLLLCHFLLQTAPNENVVSF